MESRGAEEKRLLTFTFSFLSTFYSVLPFYLSKSFSAPVST